jgi:galactose mutarotase-like enzyme
MKLNGKEVLYLDEETFKDKNTNVKGGIPILFPNAGPLTENSLYPDLEQHGFARKLEWQGQKMGDGFKETLSSNEETKKMYPYNFRLSITGNLEKDGSFTLGQEIENKENEKEMPVSMGLHPYFKVSNDEKKNIKFDFEGGNQAEDQIEKWANGEGVSIDNPKLKDPNAVIKIIIPSLGTMIIDSPIEYKKIWVWSMPGKDFFCVEPVMRDINGLINNPKMIKSKEIFKTSVNFKLE